jgi:hypothetical protein
LIGDEPVATDKAQRRCKYNRPIGFGSQCFTFPQTAVSIYCAAKRDTCSVPDFGGWCRCNLFRSWLLCPMGVFRLSIYNDYRAFCRNKHGGSLRTQTTTQSCRKQE